MNQAELQVSAGVGMNSPQCPSADYAHLSELAVKAVKASASSDLRGGEGKPARVRDEKRLNCAIHRVANTATGLSALATLMKAVDVERVDESIDSETLMISIGHLLQDLSDNLFLTTDHLLSA